MHLAAPVMNGLASAVAAAARFGPVALAAPIYAAGVQLGRLLRTVFLAAYFINAAFRREVLRVLNPGGAVNARKRAMYAGRVTLARGKRVDGIQAVAGALTLLANIVMVRNTTRMHAVLDR